MQELDKFNLKINVIPNRLEKYMRFKINNKLFFIDSFQVYSSSINSLVKSSGKNEFKHLNQKFLSNVLDFVKQRAFHLYEYMSGFGNHVKIL